MASKLPHNFIQGGPAEPLSKDLLEGKVQLERKYGYTFEGKQKRILLNAFDMNGVGHISIGQWQNPKDKSSQKNRLPYWIELAKLLERGKFNALFLADNYGSQDIYKGSHAPAIKAASQWPLYDPFSVISAMAAVTDTLAFGVTASTTFEPPFSLAKRFSTLDHLTNGRIAWMAEEYLSLVYKLWEGSWADGAVIKELSTHTYTDPTKVRKIEHQGKFYKSSSTHQVNPSPQRTPVLFQAGMSPAGSSFAAKHAECIFCGGASPALVAKNIEQTREKARENNRDPYDLKFFVQFTPILGATDQEAQEKYERYRQYALGEGGLALLGSTSGIDVSKFPWDEEFPTDPEHPLIRELTAKQRNRLLARPAGFDRWTPRILAEYQSLGGSGPYKIGSGATVADEMERWITEADVDGFNIGHIAVPGAWEDVIEYLVPDLEKRGWLGKDYPVPQGTARENLYGSPGDSHVRKTHPGYQYKFKEDV
ncbi:Bac-luciferase domain-containing protein [Fusarium sp. LHS14.1]|nr:Bac-luciferase domain-containing protein [Fusarium sp. LHS14.1]